MIFLLSELGLLLRVALIESASLIQFHAVQEKKVHR